MRKAYFNGPLFDGHQMLHGKVLLTADGKVTGLADAVPEGYESTDLKGNILSPAFIDLQIYGGNGKMFHQDTTTETIRATYEYCRSGGCGYFMITLATNTLEKFAEGLSVARQYWEEGGKGLLGVHLEGPYMNPVKRGAHIESLIRTPVKEELDMLLEKGREAFAIMTLAPECCEPALIQHLQQNGVLVSAGHSNATYQQATDAFRNGITVATHFYNAMSGLQHRAPGMVGAILDHPSVKSSVVCDGIHADYAAIRIARKILGDRLFYITDAVTETKEGDYKHLFKGDHFALPDGTLSGSALTMMKCVRNGVRELGLSLEESLRMATSIPASLVQSKKLGTLETGAEAGFVIFTDQLEIIEMVEA